MKKLALFVEGQAERIFFGRLLREIAGRQNIALQTQQQFRGRFETLESDIVGDQSYFALLADCSADSRVLSAIIERHKSLEQSGYDLVVGVRDLYPQRREDLNELVAETGRCLPVEVPPCKLFFAVMELEAWFMQEDRHFPHIGAACTRENILKVTGFDIVDGFAEDLPRPSTSLNLSYRLSGAEYKKKAWQVQTTVDALDIEYLCLDRVERLDSLRLVVEELNDFFS